MAVLPFPLSVAQQDAAEGPLERRLFLEGPAGSGKTAAGVRRVQFLQEQGAAVGEILLLLPQRTLVGPYAAAGVTPQTPGSLVQQMIARFWDLIAGPAGFAHSQQPPTFINYEAAQFFMDRALQPLLAAGAFASLSIERSRLYAQALEALNRAAAAGFLEAEIGLRLQAAYPDSPASRQAAADLQAGALAFRRFCLKHNLLDFSLQLALFRGELWPRPECRLALSQTYRHLVADNIEELPAAVCDWLYEWLPDFDSALLIFDRDAGYRTILGADSQAAARLEVDCDTKLVLEDSFVASPGVQALADELQAALCALPPAGKPRRATGRRVRPAFTFAHQRYYPEMLDWAAGQAAALIQERGLPPGEVVLLAPALSEALAFALLDRLQRLGIPARAHRPARPLNQEPAARALLTLAALAHPDWELQPLPADLAGALVETIDGLDPLRARLLMDILYRPRVAGPFLAPFDPIVPRVQERITPAAGARYEQLRGWLEGYRTGQPLPLDDFLQRLLEELLSQPGFRYGEVNKAEAAANLIDSARNFRQAAGETLAAAGESTGRAFTGLVDSGAAAAQSLRSWEADVDLSGGAGGNILIASATTFLLGNRPATAQIWLDAGSLAWAESAGRGLVNRAVLSRNWQPGQRWSHQAEERYRRERLCNLAAGLLRRCRERVFLAYSELGEQGAEQRGPLLPALRRLLETGS